MNLFFALMLLIAATSSTLGAFGGEGQEGTGFGTEGGGGGPPTGGGGGQTGFILVQVGSFLLVDVGSKFKVK